MPNSNSRLVLNRAKDDCVRVYKSNRKTVFHKKLEELKNKPQDVKIENKRKKVWQ